MLCNDCLGYMLQHDCMKRIPQNSASVQTVLPALHMQTAERPQCCFTSKELEAALRVLDPFDAEEPHQEVEAVHQECPEHRALTA